MMRVACAVMFTVQSLLEKYMELLYGCETWDTTCVQRNSSVPTSGNLCVVSRRQGSASLASETSRQQAMRRPPAAS